MTIIEADGVETEPLTVDSFAIFPSQRYSVVFTADQPIDNYCTSSDCDIGDNQSFDESLSLGIRVNPINSGVNGIANFTTGFDGGINSAILRYKGADKVDPTTSENPNGIALNESDLSVSHFMYDYMNLYLT